jgi:hypothetical protein
MKDSEEFIERIVEMELRMFLTVPADGDYTCRQRPESFRVHRSVQFSVWSTDTLKSYLDDLRRAEERGINLLTVKYARMDNLIPRENMNPLIDEIAAIQFRWQQEMFSRHPILMSGARPLSREEDSDRATSFETYLKGELETYSDNTLSLLFRDMTDLVRRGINGSEVVYEHLVRKLGYGSIDEAERAQRRNSSS